MMMMDGGWMVDGCFQSMHSMTAHLVLPLSTCPYQCQVYVDLQRLHPPSALHGWHAWGQAVPEGTLLSAHQLAGQWGVACQGATHP